MEEPAKKVLTDLPADVVQHIVARIQLAHHIARAALTCKVVSVAARNVIVVRGFSSEVVTSLTLLPDGLRFASGSWDKTARIVEHGLAPQQ